MGQFHRTCESNAIPTCALTTSSYIYSDIGGVDRWTWFVLGNLFALGAVCPFVGSLSDLFGRRYVALFGAFLLVLGNIVTSTAHTMNTFIAGMAIAGAGAGINELTSLAVTSELAPTRKRGTYVAVLIFTILPFCPSVLYGQLIASRGSWRYIGLFCGVWAFIGLVLTAIFYHPPPRELTVGMSRREVLKRVDFIGGFLSITGLLLFMAGIQWGGYQYAWTSAHVLAPMFIGLALFAAFCFYEWKFAPHPMFPRAIAKEPRILLLTLIITFISGSNFFSVLLFWPTQSYNSYGHDPLAVGIRNLALGFPILAGACIILVLLSWTGGRIRTLMVISSIFMTAGEYIYTNFFRIQLTRTRLRCHGRSKRAQPLHCLPHPHHLRSWHRRHRRPRLHYLHHHLPRRTNRHRRRPHPRHPRPRRRNRLRSLLQRLRAKIQNRRRQDNRQSLLRNRHHR
jgi:MFS family permease